MLFNFKPTEKNKDVRGSHVECFYQWICDFSVQGKTVSSNLQDVKATENYRIRCGAPCLEGQGGVRASGLRPTPYPTPSRWWDNQRPVRTDAGRHSPWSHTTLVSGDEASINTGTPPFRQYCLWLNRHLARRHIYHGPWNCNCPCEW